MLTQLALELGLADALGFVVDDLAGSQVALQRAVARNVGMGRTDPRVGHDETISTLTSIAAGGFRGEDAESTGGLTGILSTGIGY